MSSSMSGSLRGGRSRKFKSEINVVPYIDVMLVLLIIFMVVAPVTNPSVIDLPRADKTTQPPTKYIQLAIKADTTTSIGIHDPASGRTQLEAASGLAGAISKLGTLHAQNPDLPLLISASKETQYDNVVRAISEAKKVGVNRVGLATQ